MNSHAKTTHYRNLILLLLGFIAVQTIMALLSHERAFVYYGRILMLIEINIMLTVSLSLINGYTGQFSLGHAGFMAIGAYVAVTMTTILPRIIHGAALSTGSIGAHAVFIGAVLAGGCIAGLFGLIIGFPSLRLKGDYLAIVTLAAGEVIRALLKFSDVTGGPRGIPGIPKFTGFIYMGIFFVVSLWIMRNAIFSHFCRGCIAVRDNEIAAGSVGVNPLFHKVSAFVLGAFFAGIAGGLFAHMSSYINPDNFSFFKSVELLTFLYVGGSQTLAGSIVGAGIFTLIPEGLRTFGLDSLRMVLYPVVLIVVMRFRMNGIMGNHEFGVLKPWIYKEHRSKRKGDV
jgi:branched-chain amino acid transport system permease protein